MNYSSGLNGHKSFRKGGLDLETRGKLRILGEVLVGAALVTYLVARRRKEKRLAKFIRKTGSYQIPSYNFRVAGKHKSSFVTNLLHEIAPIAIPLMINAWEKRQGMDK